MATPTFYYSELAKSVKTAVLSANESAHVQKSRRLGVGRAVKLIDGQGRIADGLIAQLERNSVRVELLDTQFMQRPDKSITIATAIPKGDRQKSMIDMLTQIGVEKIIPLECEHSVTRSNSKQLAKWRRIAIEACKQSQNPWLPDIQNEHSAKQLLDWAAEQSQLRCLYADGNGESLTNLSKGKDQVLIAIGPEGGFSKIEIEEFQYSKFSAARLGKHILRTETAAICAAAQLA